MPFLSDPSNINSNSFCDLAFADAYFENRLYSDSWTGASNDDKQKSLMWASLVLSRYYDWEGVRVSEDQLLAFPRYGLSNSDGYYVSETIYPQEVKEATAELGMSLLTNQLAGDSPLESGITEIKVSSLMLKFSKDAILDDGRVDSNGISARILRIVKDYIISAPSFGSNTIPVVRT